MSKLIATTKLLNYVNNDSIIDYLDIKKRKGINYTLDTSNANFNNNKKIKQSSFDYIMSDGLEFEEQILNDIMIKMNIHNDKFIVLDYNIVKEGYVLTKKTILSKKYDLIMNSLLIDYDLGIFGKPDLIVTGKWIKKYILNFNINIDNDKYYIIDIKSSTLQLINNGKTLSNSLDYKYYKGQILIYKNMLEKLLRYKNNNYGFIISKKYSYVKNNNIVILNSFDTICTIDFSNENELIKQINNSIDWNKNILPNIWTKINVHNITDERFMPNMKNKYDGIYKNDKHNISNINKEITLLWYCGIKQRELCIKKNIYRYDDVKLTPEILGFDKKCAKYNIIKNMLKMVHSTNYIDIPKQNNVLNWRTINDNEFYIDFETYNYDNNDVLYLIGIGNFKNKWNYKKFVLNNHIYNNGYDNEHELINGVVDYIKTNNIERLIHWSNAEKNIIHKKFNGGITTDLLFDLMKVFNDNKNPIIIKECFGFGLKSILKKLNEYKLVKFKWNSFDDGLLTSFIARDIYNKKINDKKLFNNIIKYNEIDCKALYTLLKFIRNIQKN